MAHAQMVHALEEPVEACFLEASDDIWRMEEELARAVLVTVTGMRPAVDLASAAEALHSEFGIGLDDMSIRAFYPEDFLVLCHDGAVRERMVRAGKASVQLPRWHSRIGAAVSDRMGAECDEARDLGDCSSSPSSGGTVRVRSFLLDAPGISEDDMIAFPRGTGTGQISPCESFQEVDAQATVPATDVVSGTPLLLGDVAGSVQASVATMCDELRVSLSPILPRPDSRAPAGMGANQRKKRKVDATPARRSVRIAKHATTRQQQVLIRRLCLAHEGEVAVA
uniref:Uncharacterized protein n=1 Tax=Aegilops tauschii TaxID=37682 RepID=R7W7X3_AEGTA